MALYKGSTKICPIIQKGITPTGTINITENGTVDVTNYASANVSVSGGGGGNFDLPSNMKIIKATSFEVVSNDTDVDFENLITENEEEILPYLIFCHDLGIDEPDISDFVLTGGFFLGYARQIYYQISGYCIGVNEGTLTAGFNGWSFYCYAPLAYFDDGEGEIRLRKDNSDVVKLSVTWNV